MIKFLQLLMIDRPILSFLFANLNSSFLVLLIFVFMDCLFAYLGYFFHARCIGEIFSSVYLIGLNLLYLHVRIFFLIIYTNILLREKQNNFIYKFILLLKNSNLFKMKFFIFLIFIEFLFANMFKFWYMFCAFAHCAAIIFPILILGYFLIRKPCEKVIQLLMRTNILKNVYFDFNNNFDKRIQDIFSILCAIIMVLCFFESMFLNEFILDISEFILYFIFCSLSLSYLVLFLYWGLRDKCLKNIEIVKQKQIFEKVSSYINKQKTVIYRLFDKYQLPIFILTNVLCSGYIFMYLIAKFYNNEIVDIPNTSLFEENENIIDLLFLNYLYQLIRYILIFKVFDIYSKMERGLVVDFIKKLKTSSKCRKVTSIVLFVIDTLFILFLSRGTSCNHCFIYWIMSYFFGLMSMYFVMFYYWHLENKHKDVLSEVEVKEDTGVV